MRDDHLTLVSELRLRELLRIEAQRKADRELIEQMGEALCTQSLIKWSEAMIAYRAWREKQ